MKHSMIFPIAAVVFGLLAAGCDQILDSGDMPESADTELCQLMAKPPVGDILPPSPLVTAGFGGDALTFWPFTGSNFSGEGQDPINLIFVGRADPLDLRAALLALDGDRSGSGLPAIPPFNATWNDAIGDVQTGYSEAAGWCGGCVQLACGDYGPIRFHVRLFKMGDWTVGNAHFELLIPGTADHQVLAWEAAEQFVIGDFIRSGLLDPDVPMMPTAVINPAPWRTIPAIIYNEVPEDIRIMIGGPLGEVTEDVPIQTDGQATILNLVNVAPRVPETRVQDFVLEYGQVVPKPFCPAGPDDYVYVQGPVHLVQTAALSADGVYHVTFRADGELLVTPTNPMTGELIGETLTAEVAEHHDAHVAGQTEWASSMISQHLLPDTAEGAGRLFIRLQVRSDGRNAYQAMVRCADNPWESVTAWNLPAVMKGPMLVPGRELHYGWK